MPPTTPRSEYDDSLALAKDESTLDSAAVAAIAAAKDDPDVWAYQLNAGVILAREHLNQTDSAQGTKHLDDAIAYFQEADRLDPHNSLVQANLAMAFRLLGDRDGAVAAARSVDCLRSAEPGRLRRGGDHVRMGRARKRR